MTISITAILVALAAIQQVVVPFFVNPFRRGPNEVRAGERSLIEPAGYAFAIWGPIYLLALAYAGFQFFPESGSSAAFAQAAPWAIALYVGSSLWLFLASRRTYWLTIPLLAVMAICAIISLVTLIRVHEATPIWQAFAIVPFGLYAGWTACATFVNISAVAPRLGFGTFGLTRLQVDLVLLIAAILAAAIVLVLTGGNLAFAVTVVWALAAIVVSNRQSKGPMMIAVTSALGIGIALALAVVLSF